MAVGLLDKLAISTRVAKDRSTIMSAASEDAGSLLCVLKSYREEFTPAEYAGLVVNYLKTKRENEPLEKRTARHQSLALRILEFIAEPVFLEKNAIYVTQLLQELSKTKAKNIVEGFFALPEYAQYLYDKSQEANQFPIALALVNNEVYKKTHAANYGRLLGKVIRAEHDEYITLENLKYLKRLHPEQFKAVVERALAEERFELFQKIYAIFQKVGFLTHRLYLLKEKTKRNPEHLPNLFGNAVLFPVRGFAHINFLYHKEIYLMLSSFEDTGEASTECDDVIEKLKTIGCELEQYCSMADLQTLEGIFKHPLLCKKINPIEIMKQYCLQADLDLLESVFNHEYLCTLVAPDAIMRVHCADMSLEDLTDLIDKRPSLAIRMSPLHLVELCLEYQEEADFHLLFTSVKWQFSQRESSLDDFMLAKTTTQTVKDQVFANRNTQNQTIWKGLAAATRLTMLMARNVTQLDAAREDKDIFFLSLNNNAAYLREQTNQQLLSFFECHLGNATKKDIKDLKEQWVATLEESDKLSLFREMMLSYDKKELGVITLTRLFEMLAIDPVAFKEDIEIVQIIFKHRAAFKGILDDSTCLAIAKEQDQEFRQQACPDLAKAIAQESPLVQALTSISTAVTGVFKTKSSKKSTTTLSKSGKIMDLALFEKMNVSAVIEQLLQFQNKVDYRAFIAENITRVRESLFKKLKSNAKEEAAIIQLAGFLKDCVLLREPAVNDTEPLLTQNQKFELAILCGKRLIQGLKFPAVAVLFGNIFYLEKEYGGAQGKSFEKEFQQFLKSLWDNADDYKRFAVAVALKFRADPVFLKEFYGFLERADKSYSRSLFGRDEEVSLAKYLAEKNTFFSNEINIAILRVLFKAKDNEHVLGLMGEELIDIFALYPSELNDYVEKIFRAAKLYPRIYLGMLKKMPDLVKNNQEVFRMAAAQHRTVAILLFKHSDFWRYMAVYPGDSIAVFEQKVMMLKLSEDVIAHAEKGDTTMLKRLLDLKTRILRYSVEELKDNPADFLLKIKKFQEVKGRLTQLDRKDPDIALVIKQAHELIATYLCQATTPEICKQFLLESRNRALLNPSELVDIVKAHDSLLDDAELELALAADSDATLRQYILKQRASQTALLAKSPPPPLTPVVNLAPVVEMPETGSSASKLCADKKAKSTAATTKRRKKVAVVAATPEQVVEPKLPLVNAPETRKKTKKAAKQPKEAAAPAAATVTSTPPQATPAAATVTSTPPQATPAAPPPPPPPPPPATPAAPKSPTPKTPVEKKTSAPLPDSHTQMLALIRTGGHTLRKISETPVVVSQLPEPKKDGQGEIMDSLTAALNKRKKVIQVVDSDASDASDDEDWSDDESNAAKKKTGVTM